MIFFFFIKIAFRGSGVWRRWCNLIKVVGYNWIMTSGGVIDMFARSLMSDPVGFGCWATLFSPINCKVAASYYECFLSCIPWYKTSRWIHKYVNRCTLGVYMHACRYLILCLIFPFLFSTIDGKVGEGWCSEINLPLFYCFPFKV